MRYDGQANHVLIADDEENLRFVLRELLTREGCRVQEAEDGFQALRMIERQAYDLYLLDMKMPGCDGLDVLKKLRARQPNALAVMITAYGSTELAREALKWGAYDYFSKPFNMDELRTILMRALEKQRLLRKIHQLEERLNGNGREGVMFGASAAIQRVFTHIRRAAEHDVTVLVTGESGTGKELVARAIHESSARREGPFVTVNCAAIPETLLESELFGHEKGAFTGATSTRAGKFEAAAGGTILLDEIGEMPVTLQAKLLRVLQQRVIERIGSNTPQPVDLRVIAATNRDPAQLMRGNGFREDLFYRLNVLSIQLPPLREHKDDLLLLIQTFLDRFNRQFGKHVQGLTASAVKLLEQHDWPGNVRELENTIQRALVMAEGPYIDERALPPSILSHRTGMQEGTQTPSKTLEETFDLPLSKRVEQIVEENERRMIEMALAHTEGHRQRTADLLGISRKSLHNKMQKYGLFEGVKA